MATMSFSGGVRCNRDDDRRRRRERKRRRKAATASAAAALAGVALLRGNSRTVSHQQANTSTTNLQSAILQNGQGPYLGRPRRRLDVASSTRKRKRLAIVRPFAPFSAEETRQSFASWDTAFPCTFNPRNAQEDDDYEYDVDLFLSFSQIYDADDDPQSHRTMMELSQKYERNGGWNGCFDNIHHIEAAIPKELDLYERNHVQRNRHWVNGPNSQFRSITAEIQRRNAEWSASHPDDSSPYYETLLILEPDSHVQTVGWLNSLLEEMSAKQPFAILGSKYRGHSWDNFKDQIPLSLLEHINGNAVYNMTHPLTEHYLQELREEETTFFNAIPYDYRISQMIVEGRFGAPPEFPFPEMKDESGKFSVALPTKKEKFQKWWLEWGGEGDANPIKESQVIANYAATNYLPKHVDRAPIIHGKGAWKPHDKFRHDITLVVSDWTEDYAKTLISTLHSSEHPFSQVIIVREPSVVPKESTFAEKLLNWAHPEVTPDIPIRYVERSSPAYMDLCDAPVETDWFMMTNSYHRVAKSVDLMFTHDEPPRPLIPYTPAESRHCTDYPACRETVSLAREMYPQLDTVILDMDMIFHSSSRDTFCNEWKRLNGKHGELLFSRIGDESGFSFLTKGIPRGPSATVYLAYLQATNMADSIYALSNRLDRGSKDAFEKVHRDVETHTFLDSIDGRRISSSYLQKTDFGQDAIASSTTGTSASRRILQSIRFEKNNKAKRFFGRSWRSALSFFRHPFGKNDDESGDETVHPSETDDVPVVESKNVRGTSNAHLVSREAKKGGNGGGGKTETCTETGIAKTCGGRGRVAEDICCEGYICDPFPQSTNCIKDPGSYGGGAVQQRLVLESPGWLAHEGTVTTSSSSSTTSTVDAVSEPTNKTGGDGNSTPILGKLRSLLGRLIRFG